MTRHSGALEKYCRLCDISSKKPLLPPLPLHFKVLVLLLVQTIAASRCRAIRSNEIEIYDLRSWRHDEPYSRRFDQDSSACCSGECALSGCRLRAGGGLFTDPRGNIFCRRHRTGKSRCHCGEPEWHYRPPVEWPAVRAERIVDQRTAFWGPVWKRPCLF